MVLLRMGVQKMERDVRATMVTAGAGEDSSNGMGDSRGSESQGDLAETVGGREGKTRTEIDPSVTILHVEAD